MTSAVDGQAGGEGNVAEMDVEDASQPQAQPAGDAAASEPSRPPATTTTEDGPAGATAGGGSGENGSNAKDGDKDVKGGGAGDGKEDGDGNKGGETTATSENKPPRTRHKNWPLRDIKDPHENDVLYGRGGGTNHHPGNKRYRKMVEERKEVYLSSKRLDKPLVALEIIREWRAQDPPGRFLKQDDNTGLWEDVGDRKAREKTSQALREKAPQLRKEAEEKTGGTPSKSTKGESGDSADKTKQTRFDVPADDESPSSPLTESQKKRRDAVKRAVLARDHSLGRDYIETGEAVTVDGFSWQEPVKEVWGDGEVVRRVSSGGGGGPARQRSGGVGGGGGSAFRPSRQEGWSAADIAAAASPRQRRSSAAEPHHPNFAGMARPSHGRLARDHSLATNPLRGAALDQPASADAFHQDGGGGGRGGGARRHSSSRFLSNEEGTSAFSRTDSGRSVGGSRSDFNEFRSNSIPSIATEDAPTPPPPYYGRRTTSTSSVASGVGPPPPQHPPRYGYDRRQYSASGEPLNSEDYSKVADMMGDDLQNMERSWSGQSGGYAPDGRPYDRRRDASAESSSLSRSYSGGGVRQRSIGGGGGEMAAAASGPPPPYGPPPYQPAPGYGPPPHGPPHQPPGPYRGPPPPPRPGGEYDGGGGGGGRYGEMPPPHARSTSVSSSRGELVRQGSHPLGEIKQSTVIRGPAVAAPVAGEGGPSSTASQGRYGAAAPPVHPAASSGSAAPLASTHGRTGRPGKGVPRPSGLQRKLSGGKTSPPPAPPQGLPRPDAVKRDTSNKAETFETKRSIKRAVLSRDHSAAAQRLKEKADGGAAGGIGGGTTDEMQQLKSSMERSTLNGSAAGSDKPDALSAKQRMTTMDVVEKAFDAVAKPGSLGDADRTSSVDVIKSFLEDEDDDKVKPNHLSKNQRTTTVDAIAMDMMASDSVDTRNIEEQLALELENDPILRPSALSSSDRASTTDSTFLGGLEDDRIAKEWLSGVNNT